MWQNPLTMRTVCIALLLCVVTGAQAPQNLIPVKVELITRAVSKTPVLIAYDRGIYRNGLASSYAASPDPRQYQVAVKVIF